MLLINILTEDNTNFKGRFFKKQVRPDPFYRSSVKIRNRICTIIEFNESMLGSIDLQRLLNTFKGNIIGSDTVLEKVVPAEYRFDLKPYMKRAVLGALIKNLDYITTDSALTVKDEKFILTDEYKKLAKQVKSLTVITADSVDTGEFCNYCFVEYGLFVKISQGIEQNFDDVYIDFDDMDINGKAIIKKQGRDQLLYPDPTYFTVAEDLQPLLRFNISPRLLCAAFEE